MSTMDFGPFHPGPPERPYNDSDPNYDEDGNYIVSDDELEARQDCLDEEFEDDYDDEDYWKDNNDFPFESD
jgi:hypothetical protein